MNKSPINYATSLVIAAVLWVISAIFLGGYLGNRVNLQTIDLQSFLFRYRLAISIAAIIGVANVFYWFLYGSKDSTVGDMEKAKRLWTVLFMEKIVSAAGLVMTLSLMFMSEGIAVTDYFIMFVILLIQTVLYYYFCTFNFSPLAVKFIPWGKK